MNVSQVLNHINEQNYDDDITVTDIPPKNFLAVTGNSFEPGNKTRHIRVDILPIDTETQSTQTVNSGLFVRQDGEENVQATVYQDGRELASNTQAY